MFSSSSESESSPFQQYDNNNSNNQSYQLSPANHSNTNILMNHNNNKFQKISPSLQIRGLKTNGYLLQQTTATNDLANKFINKSLSSKNFILINDDNNHNMDHQQQQMLQHLNNNNINNNNNNLIINHCINENNNSIFGNFNFFTDEITGGGIKMEI